MGKEDEQTNQRKKGIDSDKHANTRGGRGGKKKRSARGRTPSLAPAEMSRNTHQMTKTPQAPEISAIRYVG